MKRYSSFLLALFVLAACGTRQTNAEEKKASAPEAAENVVVLTAAEMQTAGMEVGLPQKGMTSTFVEVNGLVDVPPQNVVSVSFPMGGYLASSHLLPGMKVRRGQVLAQMKDPALIQLQQDYLIARSRVGFLQKEYERQKLLNATKTTSDKVLEQTQSEYQAQRILMNSLRQKLQLIGLPAASLHEDNIRQSVPLYAPIDGYVSAVHVHTGQYVTPSDVLFELVNPRDLHVALKVFEKDLPYIRVGQPVKVRLVNKPGEEFEAKVSLIGPNLDADRSAVVHCHLLRRAEELLPGMFASARIAVENKEALTVPEEALVRWGEGQYVFLQIDKGAFEMTPVRAGTTDSGRTEVSGAATELEGRPMILKNAYAALMKLQNKAE